MGVYLFFIEVFQICIQNRQDYKSQQLLQHIISALFHIILIPGLLYLLNITRLKTLGQSLPKATTESFRPSCPIVIMLDGPAHHSLPSPETNQPAQPLPARGSFSLLTPFSALHSTVVPDSVLIFLISLKCLALGNEHSFIFLIMTLRSFHGTLAFISWALNSLGTLPVSFLESWASWLYSPGTSRGAIGHG